MEPNIPNQPIQAVTPQPVIQHPQMPIKPRRAWKKWVLIIIVLLLLFSIPIGGYLVLNQLGVNPKPTKVVVQNIKPTPTPDPTINWKTYNSEEFSFRHPDTMSLTASASGHVKGKLSVTGGYMEFGTIYTQSTPFKVPTEGKIFNHLSDKYPISGVEKSTLTVNNTDVDIYVTGCEAGGCYYLFAYFNNTVKYYEIKFNIAGGSLQTKAEKILSTIKFTDQTSQNNTTNWKTFTSTVSGYLFRYPNDWTEHKSDEINETEAFLTAPPDPECPKCGGGLNGVNVSIRLNPKNMSLTNFIDNELTFGNFANDKIISSRLNTIVMIDRDASGAGSGQEALIAHRQKVIDFYCGSCTNEFMDQILSTFKFTN